MRQCPSPMPISKKQVGPSLSIFHHVSYFFQAVATASSVTNRSGVLLLILTFSDMPTLKGQCPKFGITHRSNIDLFE
jgi:hypothetical protein